MPVSATNIGNALKTLLDTRYGAFAGDRAGFTADVGTAVANEINAQALVGAIYVTAAGQSIPGGNAFTIINFDTKDQDTDNAVTTGASWKFTVPSGKGGWYHVSAVATFAAAFAFGIQLNVFKNGAGLRRMDWIPGSAGTVNLVEGGLTLFLAAGDYIDIRIAQGDAGAHALSAFTSDVWVSIFGVASSPVPPSGGSASVDGETPAGAINGSNVTFTLASAPSPTSSLHLFQNGVRLKLTTHYTLSGATITMVAAPSTGEVLLADYLH